MSNIISYDS